MIIHSWRVLISVCRVFIEIFIINRCNTCISYINTFNSISSFSYNFIMCFTNFFPNLIFIIISQMILIMNWSNLYRRFMRRLSRIIKEVFQFSLLKSKTYWGRRISTRISCYNLTRPSISCSPNEIVLRNNINSNCGLIIIRHSSDIFNRTYTIFINFSWIPKELSQ